MRVSRYRSTTLAAVAVTLLVASGVLAQEFFRVAPGPLSNSHKKWDNSKACDACHKKGEGVTNLLCLKCHNHQSLRQAIESGRGLHARFGDRRCLDCHSEHKGRNANIVDWSKIGGQRSFDHGRTGFVLAGKHRSTSCTSCHKRRLASGRTSYVGLTTKCWSCHKDPHDFTRDRFNARCDLCHGVGRAKKLVAARSIFDHDGETDFPLRGGHKGVRCQKCHRHAKMPRRTPPRSCADCHKSPHGKRFAQLNCEDCHFVAGSEKVRFDHDRLTKMRLLGGHKQAKCRECHRGDGPRKFERFQSIECRTCHRHQNTHRGQFDDKPCTHCHVEGGTRTKPFDHQADTGFALTGFHRRLAKKGNCRRCHPKKLYRTNKLACPDCHADKHGGTLGTECERCHQTDVRFTKTVFDHLRQSQFPLQGKHQEVRCAKCHPEKQYKHGRTTCVQCHAEDDPHRGKLGSDCARCHIPAKGAPLFAHRTMTAFTRDGAHSEIACVFCHQEPSPEVPGPVGWTKRQKPPAKNLLFAVIGTDCSGCHRDYHGGSYGAACQNCHNTRSFAEVDSAPHDFGDFRLAGAHDQLPCGRCHNTGLILDGAGELCFACHWRDDAHRGGLGPFCGDCHGQEEWFPTRFNHATTGYVLRGAHRLATCDGCHGVGRFVGTPTDCITCHQKDARRAVDPNHNMELAECENCHNETAFLPARQYHPSYRLTGAHVTLQCRECHGSGFYGGTPDLCIGCHRAQYADPNKRRNHIAEGFSTDCEDCHTAASWLPARGP